MAAQLPAGNNADEERAPRRYLASVRRDVRNVVDPFDLPDDFFRKSFRLTKPLVRLLVRVLRPFLPPDHEALAVPNHVKVLTALTFYATGSYQAPIGSSWMHCLGRSTVSTFITQVTGALNERTVQLRWIRFPHTIAERRQLSRMHQEKFKIPGILGFTDGTEVTIVKPPQDLNPQAFWTRKHQYALNCMATCDSNLIFRHINTSYPGACNDTFIFKHSALRRKLRECFEEQPSHWVLGDSGYPTEPWMVIPILHAEEGSPEDYFTSLHCKARCCIERCFGVFKGRFRCLLRARALHYHPLKAGKIVKACAVLHNMCRIYSVPDNDVDAVEGEEDPVCWVPNPEEALEESFGDNEPDAALVVHEERNILEIGTTVRQRIVEFLQIMRADEE